MAVLMARDGRLFFKLTLDFPDHAKVFPLSDAAFRCLVEAIAYSRKHETDGLLARRYAVARWSLDVLRELCTNDPEKPSLLEREEGFYIHDYAEMNDTAAEIQARRDRNKMAGKQGGLARAKRGVSKSLSKSLSETQAEEEEEKDREITTDVVISRASRAKPRKRIDPTFMPSQAAVDTIKAETGATSDQLRKQHQLFVDHFQGTGRPMADWTAAWRKWMRTAHDRGELGGTVTRIGSGGTDAKGNEWIQRTAQMGDLPTTAPALEARA